MFRTLLLFLMFGFAQAQQVKKAQQAKIEVDHIVHNAKIYTANENFEIFNAMAMSKGKIIALGTDDLILKHYKSKHTQNLQKKIVYPGFIDAHCHFTGFALDTWKCELWGTKSWQEILEKITDYAKTAPQEWIYGRSWDQNDWAVKEFPNKAELDKLFPNRPVYLKRIDGHAAIANQKALDIAKINTKTAVQGGEIEVSNGKLTGILVDNAMLLVEKYIPEIDENLALSYINQLQKSCFQKGLTMVHDCGISESMFELLYKAQASDSLQMKIYALLEDNPETYDKWMTKGRFTNGKVTFGGYKVYADGALGSRGACLTHDYEDKPGWKGFLLSDQQHFRDMAQKLVQTNLQMCTHAIGDSANHVILEIYGEVLKKKNNRRWRIEHAQIVNKKDFDLFGKYSIVPSVQPTHATSDMYWAKSRLGGERLKNAYAYRQLLEQNGWLPLGTDFPVEDIDPLKTFFAAVVRKDSKGFPAHGFQPENGISRKEALLGMTIWAARASFDNGNTGSLEAGKSADFIIADQDIMTVPEGDILKTKILETWIDDKKVY